MDIHLPLHQVKLHPTDKPWFTPEIKEAWAKGSNVLFSFWRNKITKHCKSARRTFYMVSVNSQETTPKKWWDNIKRLSGQSRSAPLSTFVVNDSVLSGLDLAEVINDSFSKISSDMQALEYSPVPVDHTPDEFIITPVAVERSLLAVKEGKSPGPDDIPNWLLKDFAPVISCPIASIRQGKVPLLWKCAAKAPKPKSVESDLRPISLTAVLSKVLEGFVFSWFCPIVMPHIDPHQFGGIRDSSTSHALVRLIHEWLQAAETPKAVIRSCLIDFSKAFDRIDYNILIHKLGLLNVPLILLNWCASFLQDRFQGVKLGQVKSSWKSINAGVPQGTKLGPLFFLVMINDLSTSLPIYKYIDDCTIFEVVTPASATSTLQKEVDQINQWTVSNNMRLNTKKTKEFTICFAKSQVSLDPLVVNNQ